MNCRICDKISIKVFRELVLSKYKVDYFYCSSCDFIQTEKPHWLKEAYEKPINLCDTGYVYRNIFYSNKIQILLSLLGDKKDKYLDYGAGYGMFVRLMRDKGFDFYWDDLFTKNIFANGFEWKKHKVKAITFFELAEHLEDLPKLLCELNKYSDLFIFSTDLKPSGVPEPNSWWYYGFEHGQHISFYSKKTLNIIAKEFGLNYYNQGSLHIISKNMIPKWKINFMRLHRLGLNKFFKGGYKNLIWSDHKKLL